MFSYRTSLFVALTLATLGGCRAGHGDPPETDSETSTGTMSGTTDTMTMTTVGPTTEPSETLMTTTVPDCGNGIREGDEQCDDGNGINTDECLDTCEMASCGDGHIYAGDEDGEGAEACDDGNEVENDACDNNCEPPVCGNGEVEGGEECDLGDMNNNNAECTLQCRDAFCGDGYVYVGFELCDKGDDNSNGYNVECNEACGLGASCGDSVLQPEHEECEGDDKCTDCFADRIVFVTSSVVKGDVGVDGADALCQNLASSLDPEVTGTFLAWLGDMNTAPGTRFGLSDFAGNFILHKSGKVIAEGWAGLTSGSLKHQINEDETGSTVDERVWTGLKEDGTAGSHCMNWTSPSESNEGTSGKTEGSDSKWTNTGAVGCDNSYRLYCFQTSLD